MPGIDLDMNAIELFDDVADGKWCQIFQAAFPIDLRFRNSLGVFRRSFCGA